MTQMHASRSWMWQCKESRKIEISILTDARGDVGSTLLISSCTSIACQSGNTILTWTLTWCAVASFSGRSNWMTVTSCSSGRKREREKINLAENFHFNCMPNRRESKSEKSMKNQMQNEDFPSPDVRNGIIIDENRNERGEHFPTQLPPHTASHLTVWYSTTLPNRKKARLNANIRYFLCETHKR